MDPSIHPQEGRDMQRKRERERAEQRGIEGKGERERERERGREGERGGGREEWPARGTAATSQSAVTELAGAESECNGCYSYTRIYNAGFMFD